MPGGCATPGTLARRRRFVAHHGLAMNLQAMLSAPAPADAAREVCRASEVVLVPLNYSCFADAAAHGGWCDALGPARYGCPVVKTAVAA